jgi:hypothetical protein
MGRVRKSGGEYIRLPLSYGDRDKPGRRRGQLYKGREIKGIQVRGKIYPVLECEAVVPAWMDEQRVDGRFPDGWEEFVDGWIVAGDRYDQWQRPKLIF